MNIGDFLHNRKWRTIQNYTYSFGASVVLIGALAKLEHWPAASGFLMTGLGMEALIFFISAFEPLLDTPDWKRVYPQLREGDESQRNIDLYKELDKESGRPSIGEVNSGVISIKDLPAEQIKKLNESFDKLSKAAEGITEISRASAETNGFIQNLHEASKSLNKVVESNNSISETLNENVHEISKSFKTAAEKINLSGDKASAGIIQSTEGLSTSIKTTGENIKASGEKASSGIVQSIVDLSNSLKNTGDGIKDSGKKASEGIVQSVGDLSNSLKTSGEVIKKSSEQASTNMTQSVNDLSGSVKTIASELKNAGEKFSSDIQKNSGKYVESIDKLNKNLGALNTAYEIHLKGAVKVEEVVKEYSNSVGEIGKLLHTSVEETRKFNESTKEINENIQALNKVYGRMLGALNTKK